MLRQLGRLARAAVALDIGARRAEDPAQAQQVARDRILRRPRGHAQREVDAVVHQVDQAVGEHQLDLQPGVRRRDDGQQGRDEVTPEGERRAHPQRAARALAEVAHRDLAAVHGLQCARRVAQEHLPGGGEDEPPGGALEEGGAEAAFELGDLLADLGTRAAERARRGRHAAALDHANEALPGR